MTLRKNGKIGKELIPFRVFCSVVLGAWCLITVVLIGNIIISSFKTNVDIFTGLWGPPHKIVLSNYVSAFQAGFGRYLLNTVTIVTTSIAFIILISSMAAYGLSTFSFRGNHALRLYFLLGLMFPMQLATLPLFCLLHALHLVNHLTGVILIYSADVSVAILIMTNFLKSIPNAMRESAKIDGAGEFRIYAQIILPLMKPAIGAFIPLTVAGLWNEFYVPLVFISSKILKTLPLGLMQFYGTKGFDISKLGIVFAAVTISIIPLLVSYLFGSSKIISGLTDGSVK